MNRNVLKCEYIRYSPLETSTMNSPNSQTNINIPRRDSVKTPSKRFLDVNFDVLITATINRDADDNDIRLVNLRPIALFRKYKLTLSSGKHLENIEHRHIACLIYKIIIAARGCDHLSIAFDRSRDRKQRELTNIKNIKCKFHVRIMLRDILGFAEHQEKATYGLGYKLTITRNAS